MDLYEQGKKDADDWLEEDSICLSAITFDLGMRIFFIGKIKDIMEKHNALETLAYARGFSSIIGGLFNGKS